MRSSPLALLLLISAQAVVNMGGEVGRSAGAANRKAGHQERARKRLHRSATQKQDGNPNTGGLSADSPPDPYSPVVDPKLFSKRHYRPSPRVIFTDSPQSYDILESEFNDMEGVRGARVRRAAAGSRTMHRGEYSVCEANSNWMELNKATDLIGNEVTVLFNVTINNVVKKQLFYQTFCVSPTQRGPGAATKARAEGKGDTRSSRSGCLGIDKRHWNSYCTNTHIFVSALTTYNSLTAWRYIRINAACVCVVSRKSWAGGKV